MKYISILVFIPALLFAKHDDFVKVDIENFRHYLIASSNKNVTLAIDNQGTDQYWYHLGQASAYIDVHDNLYKYYK